MFSTLSFTKRYVLALTIIAMLSTLAYVNLDYLISRQSHYAKSINLSSEQKRLSQQIAFNAIYYKTKDLKKNIKLMEDAHNQLLASPMSKELKKVFLDEPIMLDKKIKEFLFHGKRFYETKDGRSLNYLLENSKTLLPKLEKALSIYLKDAEESTSKLKKVEFYIFIFTLLTLFFEAIFIFRPANKSINRKTKELTTQKDYLHAVIESSTNAIITLDKEFKIRTYNRMAASIFGYTKKEMINQPNFNKIVPKLDLLLKEFGVDKLLTAIELEKKGSVREIEGVNKDMKKFPIRISFGRSGENKDIAIVANIQDISKEKLNDKVLQHQAKFAALGEMIAIISHQWRQPLAQLSFNCMYIKKKLTDKELKKEINKNEDIIQFMSQTITNFEDFYKKTDNSDFNPSFSVEQALKIVDSSLHLNQIDVIKEFKPNIVVYGNVNALAHVVLSIIQNSIDIIRQGGIENPKIEISLYCVRGRAVLMIQDNAGGIKEAIVNEIFEPFISKKRTPSSGIGLYMSKLIIESKFKGKIEAQNVNQGARFTITFPCKTC